MKRSYTVLLVASFLIAAGCAGGKGRQNGSQVPSTSGTTAPRTGDSVAASSPDTTIPPDAETGVDSETPTDTSASGERGATDSATPPDSDGDGVADSADRCPSTRTGDRVDPDGCTSLVVVGGEPGRDCLQAMGFISNRNGFQNVYLQSAPDAEAQNITESAGLSLFSDLDFFQVERPGERPLPILAFTKTGRFSMEPQTVFQALPRDAVTPLPEEPGWLTYAFVRKPDGSKGAYFRRHLDSRMGLWLTELRVMPFEFPPRVGVAETIGMASASASRRIAWWGNRLIFDTTVLSESYLFVAHNLEVPMAVDPLFFVDSAGTLTQARGSEPAVSPDGTQLAFVETPHGIVTISVCQLGVNAAGDMICQNKHLLFESVFRGSSATSPSWSPDGRWIYFSSDRPPHVRNREIYKISADGTGDAIRLTNNPADDRSPVAIVLPHHFCD